LFLEEREGKKKERKKMYEVRNCPVSICTRKARGRRDDRGGKHLAISAMRKAQGGKEVRKKG
jgi:hypothetical protein